MFPFYSGSFCMDLNRGKASKLARVCVALFLVCVCVCLTMRACVSGDVARIANESSVPALASISRSLVSDLVSPQLSLDDAASVTWIGHRPRACFQESYFPLFSLIIVCWRQKTRMWRFSQWVHRSSVYLASLMDTVQVASSLRKLLLRT